ncbi:MAG: MBL fold metallo-hydrolase [Candidatus Hodarchaeota archaeon]
MKITRIKQSCFIIEMAGQSICIDPFKVPKDAKKADIILISHTHPDHASKGSINNVKKEDTEIICPATSGKLIKKWNAKGLDVDESIDIKGINIKGVPAYNLNKSWHKKEMNWLGYVINGEGISMYHAGDTDFVPELKKLIGLDYAFIPVGGQFTMNDSEAMEMIEAIKPKNMIPMHQRGMDLAEFKKTLEEKIPGVNVITLLANEEYSA